MKGNEKMREDGPLLQVDSRGLKGFFEAVNRFVEDLKDAAALQLAGVKGEARAFVACALWAARRGPVVMVLPDIRTRNRVAQALEAFRDLLGQPLDIPSEARILTFPSYELTPYLDEWMQPSVASGRVKGLFALLKGAPTALLTTPEALVPRLVSPKDFQKGIMTLTPGDALGDRDAFLRELFYRGYAGVPSVELPGDMAVRGGVMDVFSPMEEDPVRIELEGDEVASLRVFDPATQRTTRVVTRYVIGPAQELFPQSPVAEIRKRLYALQTTRRGKNAIRRLLKSLEAGESFENRLWLSSYLFEMTSDFFAYMPPETPVFWWDPEECLTNLERFHESARKQHERKSAEFPLFPPPKALFLSPGEAVGRLEKRPLVSFGLYVTKRMTPRTVDILASEPFQPMGPATDRAAAWPPQVVADEARRLHGEGYEVWIAEPEKRQRARLIEMLLERDLAFPVLAHPEPDREDSRGGIIEAAVPESFLLPRLKLALLTRSRAREGILRRGKEKPSGLRVSDLAVFKEGDPLVHVDYGIGLYRGLKRVDVLGKPGEFMVMEYAKGDKLFVPIDRLDAVQRYVGSSDTPPPLDTLGTASWEKKKARLREDVAKIARELLDLYATRKAVKGYAFDGATEGLREFEGSFPYQETPDQKRAIEEIYLDMASETPMDRLVCGDVGFGKTEVAMRAAFKSVMEGKQVAILVPTTVLAEQHYVNFSRRFSPYPVRVELLSRFRSRQVQREVVADLKKGKVDIVIGTHRLLQKDVAFRDLGLLIIDEEHRFGVTHKELLKKLSATVDVLTLTATPIPRTLQMSLSGLRDLSLINTPPRARLPVMTKIARFRKDVIAEGIERELARGGQVFFVYNRVKTIAKMARLVQELVPETRVTYAHGQMDEKALEEVMLAFMRHEIDVLVCTTIIESGVDIPNANTLFVHHAEQFGLSTLYQLRGRIGRSDRQAYAYFLVPHRAILPREAIKRLQSLQEFSNLGSGFKLSMTDLNMRGGGDLLGRRQSGRIAEVGFDLYMKIIEEEVKKLKGEWVEPAPQADLTLPFTLLLPESYIPEMGLRLMFYRRLSTATRTGEVTEIADEMRDRFGPLPPEANRLLDMVRLKIWLTEQGVITLHGKKNEIVVGFSEGSSLDRSRLVALLQEDPRHYRMAPSQKLIVRMKMPDSFPDYLEKLTSILKQFLGYDKNSNSPI